MAPNRKSSPQTEAPGAEVPAQFLQKVLPGGGLHFLIKRQGHNPIHAVISKQVFPILGRIDQRRGGAQHQGIRVTGKGDDTPAAFRRQSLHGAKQRLMSKMHPVKKSQGVDIGSHGFYPFFVVGQ